ncbi:MAG: hypothetical protein ACPL7D_04290, partial [Candidatus Sumerlaeaceae bacterium]
MAISLHQVQKLTQRLAMTPLMQQALHLLQLPNAELEQLVRDEVVQNPFLEIKGELEDDREEYQQNEESLSSEATEDQPAEVGERAETIISNEQPHFDEVDVAWDDLYDDTYSRPSPRSSVYDPDEEERDLEDFVAAPESLADSLRWQVRMLPANDRLREIA